MENKQTQPNDNNDTIEQENLLNIEFCNFICNDFQINEAKQYTAIINYKKYTNNAKQLFFNVLSGITTKFNGDILLNGVSIKKNKKIKQYLQQNSLFLTKNLSLLPDLTAKENLQLLSYFYTSFNLSNASLSSFLINDIADTKIKFLSKDQQQMIFLSLCVSCPAILWFIDETLLLNLNEEQLDIFNNAVKIRTKHGGAIVIVK